MQLELATAARFIAADRRVTVLAARDAALLAWLAVEGSTPRAPLAQLLWPGSPTARAGAERRTFGNATAVAGRRRRDARSATRARRGYAALGARPLTGIR